MSLSEETGSRPTGRLSITAPAGVDIEVSDADFGRVDGGTGKLELELAPGVYFIKWSAAGRVEDKTIRIRSGGDKAIHGGEFPLGSAPPYSAERASSLEKQQFAVVEKAISRSELGYGSEILVIVRSANERPTADLGRSIRLADSEGQDMRSGDVSEAEVPGPAQQIAVRRYKIPPGGYLLRFEASDRRRMEQTVYAFEGRQTVCFLKYGSQFITEKRTDGERITPRRGIVPQQSTFISVPLDGMAATAFEDAMRFADILLHKIAVAEPLADLDRVKSLSAPGVDPYLKLYAATVLLQRAQEAKADAGDLCSALIHGLPPPAAPDQRCLQWRLAMRSDEAAIAVPGMLTLPPMLDIGWRWASEFSVLSEAEIGVGAAFRAASRISEPQLPWLVWRHADRASGTADDKQPTPMASAMLEIQVDRLVDMLSTNPGLGAISLFGPVIRGLSPGTLEIANATASIASLGLQQSRKSAAQQLAFATGLPAGELSRQIEKSVSELDSLQISEDGEALVSRSK